MIEVRGYSVRDSRSPLAPFVFERREPGPLDVQIEILYCGICHSDLHQCRNDWSNSLYPMVPGHEIVGRVVRVGARVKKLKAGDLAAVGCMVDSCRECSACKADLEQYCEKVATWTYNSKERGSDRLTFGGYSEQIVVDERFVVTVPAGLDLEGCGAAAVRRNHDLLAVAPLAGRARPESRCDRPRRARPHGREVRQGAGRARRHDHDVAGEGQGCEAPRRRRGAALARCVRDGQALRQLRFPAEHDSREPRRQSLPRAAEARQDHGSGGRADRARAAGARLGTSSSVAATSRAPGSAAWRRRRRC